MGRKLDTLGEEPGRTQAHHRGGGRWVMTDASWRRPLRRRAWRPMRNPLGIVERAQFDAVRRTMRRESLNVPGVSQRPQERFPWELGGLLYMDRRGIPVRFSWCQW